MRILQIDCAQSCDLKRPQCPLSLQSWFRIPGLASHTAEHWEPNNTVESVALRSSVSLNDTGAKGNEFIFWCVLSWCFQIVDYKEYEHRNAYFIFYATFLSICVLLYMHRAKNGMFEKLLMKRRKGDFSVECGLASSSPCTSWRGLPRLTQMKGNFVLHWPLRWDTTISLLQISTQIGTYTIIFLVLRCLNGIIGWVTAVLQIAISLSPSSPLQRMCVFIYMHYIYTQMHIHTFIWVYSLD